MADEKSKAPLPAPQPMYMESPEQRAQREMAEAARMAAERNATEGPEGGRYLVGADARGQGGTWVDANGNEIKAEKQD